MVTSADFQRSIRSVPDFPKKGIMFRDITTLLKEPEIFRASIDAFVARYRKESIQKVVSVESRGFIFGSALAYALGAGFVPVRKAGKLPAATIQESYQLEYGSDTLELHRDAIIPGERILIIDDLLATGGTVLAAAALVERLGGTIAGLAFLIELAFLQGRKRLGQYDIYSLVTYARE
jgi:adenine phosphoribosyltransferase